MGLGLATIFRKVCKDRNCILFKETKKKKIENSIYKYNNKCYKFKSKAETCDYKKKIIQFKTQKIDLIKMDVETHESEVIDGFSSHLVHYKPSMIVEVIRDFTASHLQDKLSNVGYNYFYINESITLSNHC